MTKRIEKRLTELEADSDHGINKTSLSVFKMLCDLLDDAIMDTMSTGLTSEDEIYLSIKFDEYKYGIRIDMDGLIKIVKVPRKGFMTERENHFLDLLCGSHEFFTVKAWMEKNMPEEWEEYLGAVPNQPERRMFAKIFNIQLDLSNLVTYLIENRGWGWRECPTYYNSTSCYECEGETGCNRRGKILHPTLVWWDKEEKDENI